MADYPSTLKVSNKSFAKPVNGVISDRGSDGTLRGRILHGDKLEFTIVHFHLTSSEVTTLKNFYDTNRGLSFNFTWVVDGETYTCMFLGKPQYTVLAGTARKAVVKLGEV